MSVSNRVVRQPHPSTARGTTGLVALTFVVSAVVLVAGTLFAVASPYSHDEAIYLLMAEAARAGRLWIPNGYELFPSESLKIRFLLEGPLGLVPQYPSGYGFLALPFYLAWGARGLMLMNAFAYLAAMATTYGLARCLEASRHVALAAALIFGFGTFSIAYAVGIWPHAVAVAAVSGSTLAVIAAARYAESGSRSGLLLLAGALVGFGTTVRVDVILLAPPVLIWLLAQREHWRKAALYVAGLSPGLMLASVLNFLKLGSWLPLEYGGGGNTALELYWPLVPAIASALLMAVLLSDPRVRGLCSARNLAAAAVAVVVAVLAFEPTRSLLVQIGAGLYVLVVDFQAYQPEGPVAALFSRTEHGHLLLIGQLKRSLLQSLPALGALTLLGLATRKENRPVVILFLLITAFWILPFALRSWHGGTPQNMRYFMPILPLVSGLLAVTLARLYRESRISRRTALGVLLPTALGAAIGAIHVFTGVHRQEPWALTVATRGSLILAAAIAATAVLIAGLRGRSRKNATRLSLVLVVAGLAWGGATSFGHDLLVSQAMRSVNAAGNRSAADLEDGILVITGTAFRFMPQLMRPNSFVAVTGDHFDAGERALIEYHLGQGRRVFVDGRVADNVMGALGSPAFDTVEVPFGLHGLMEIRAPGPGTLEQDPW